MGDGKVKIRTVQYTTMSLPSDTLKATKIDVKANPSHVRDQPIAAMTPDNNVPGAAAATTGNEAETKDLEGINESVKVAESGSSDETAAAAVGTAGGGRPKRQKKLAVLTSGGDSAGMNAAGA